MSEYFVVLSNLSSIPCILYYQYQKEHFYSLQVLFNSLFSFLHHMNTSGLVRFQDNGVFHFLDGLYSYLSIFVFSTYLLLENHRELRAEHSISMTVIVVLAFLNLSTIISLPVTIFLILFVSALHYQNIRPLSICSPYLHWIIALCAADIGFYFAAMQTDYNYFHSAHHFIGFNLPIVVDLCVRNPQDNRTNP
jgi:hypothetical protein